MAYFNPIVYFIKSFIRLFTRKFFWVLLILIFMFFGFILFNNNGVFAETTYGFNYDNVFTDSDINKAFQLARNTFNNNIDNIDIILFYYPLNTVSSNEQKCVLFFDTSTMPTSSYYYIDFINGMGGSLNNHNYYYDILRYNNGGNNFSSFSKFLYSITDNHLVYSGKVSKNNASLDSLWKYFHNSTYYYSYPLKTKFSIYNDINKTSVVLDPVNREFVAPSFLTTNEELQTFDFDYLQINGGTTKYESYFEPLNQTYTAEFKLTYYYKGVATNIDILPEYVAVNRDSNTWQINIPYNVLTNKVIVRNGEKFSYRFSYKNGYESGYEMTTGELTYNLTNEQEEQINADSDKQLQGQMLETQQQTNDKLDNLDNTINDSNIDNITDDTLPTDNTNDITLDGVNGIFTSIYNAFCTGNAQDIVFPIPFTNKNFTLQANYLNNMLSSNGASWVVTIIQAFWWYLISRFIIKDVMDKINKIKSGNIEDIETTNIRGDML